MGLLRTVTVASVATLIVLRASPTERSVAPVPNVNLLIVARASEELGTATAMSSSAAPA